MNPSSASTSLPSAPPCALPVPLPAPADRRAAEARWFDAEIRRHEPELRLFLQARFPALRDVDDLIQEAYSRLWRAKVAGHATLTRAYLFVIARNCAFDLVRRRQVVRFEPLEQATSPFVIAEEAHPAEQLAHAQELEVLADAIRALPPRCAEIFTLRRIDGLSYAEIATKLGLAERTVNAQLAIGMIRVRQFLAERGFGPAQVADETRTKTEGNTDIH